MEKRINRMSIIYLHLPLKFTQVSHERSPQKIDPKPVTPKMKSRGDDL
jgi:hypothetical protein